jgi:hypothetical protein
MVLVKPVFNKIINSRIFFFKASYKKLIINFYWFCLHQKAYLICFLNMLTKKKKILIRYKSYNFQTVTISNFYNKVFFSKQKKLSYKLLKI